MEHLEETGETFLERMRRLSQEAKERFENMTSEQQQLLMEASRWHEARVRSEIMVSYPVGFENNKKSTDNEPPTGGHDTNQ